jgi:hypothetical protein
LAPDDDELEELEELAPDELLELDDELLLELPPHAASATAPNNASTALGTDLLNFCIVPPPQRLWVPARKSIQSSGRWASS